MCKCEILFVADQTKQKEVAGSRVLELGSY